MLSGPVRAPELDFPGSRSLKSGTLLRRTPASSRKCLGISSLALRPVVRRPEVHTRKLSHPEDRAGARLGRNRFPGRCAPPPRGAAQEVPLLSKIRVAIVGVGNCASSLVQGVASYKATSEAERDLTGLMNWNLGGYTPADVEFVAAFDVD